MTYAVIDNGAVVSTAEEMPNGDFKITIDGKDYITSNLELWAVECGYTLFDVEDMEINIHPMYTFYHSPKNPGPDWSARPEDSATMRKPPRKSLLKPWSTPPKNPGPDWSARPEDSATMRKPPRKSLLKPWSTPPKNPGADSAAPPEDGATMRKPPRKSLLKPWSTPPKNPGADSAAPPEDGATMYTFFVEGADLDAIEIDPPPVYRLDPAAGDRVILGFDHGGVEAQLTFVALNYSKG